MIGKVIKPRAKAGRKPPRVAGLVRYLYATGEAQQEGRAGRNAHENPHIVAAWDDADPAALEPAETGRTVSGGRAVRDFRKLVDLLEAPLLAAGGPARPVWHCPLRADPNDRRLTDAEWADVARDVMERTGLAPADDPAGCRWIAVRHADEHVHLVVTLARQDGRLPRIGRDYYAVGEACRAAEEKYDLRRTGPRDRTAAPPAHRAEAEKFARAQAGPRPVEAGGPERADWEARRDRLEREARRPRSGPGPEPVRPRLRREVRIAAAGAGGVDEFMDRLRGAGLLVRPRYSERDPGEVTGYSVALPPSQNATRAGDPVWYGGGKLAADLTLPKLRARWETVPAGAATGEAAAGEESQSAARTGGEGRPGGHTRGGSRPRLTAEQRHAMWTDAAATATHAAEQVRRLAAQDPAAAGDAAHAAADALTATARLAEGSRGGPLTDAADAYDRAARELYARPPRRTPTGSGLRSTARLLAVAGGVGKNETTQLLALIAALSALADAVADLRTAQLRAVQAAAARDTAQRLRTVAPTDGRPAGGADTRIRTAGARRTTTTRPAPPPPPTPPRRSGPGR